MVLSLMTRSRISQLHSRCRNVKLLGRSGRRLSFHVLHPIRGSSLCRPDGMKMTSLVVFLSRKETTGRSLPFLLSQSRRTIHSTVNSVNLSGPSAVIVTGIRFVGRLESTSGLRCTNSVQHHLKVDCSNAPSSGTGIRCHPSTRTMACVVGSGCHLVTNLLCLTTAGGSSLSTLQQQPEPVLTGLLGPHGASQVMVIWCCSIG